jgi:hypothetical protein
VPPTAGYGLHVRLFWSAFATTEAPILAIGMPAIAR